MLCNTAGAGIHGARSSPVPGRCRVPSARGASVRRNFLSFDKVICDFLILFLLGRLRCQLMGTFYGVGKYSVVTLITCLLRGSAGLSQPEKTISAVSSGPLIHTDIRNEAPTIGRLSLTKIERRLAIPPACVESSAALAVMLAAPATD
ncbi:hypothetical protein PGT21_012120 [Puccinia graminis f. sp. tritici]|uniref:Uncharacterized protein n=1 Tax=Puccinia graminis f. sp. tritici TaxID=56615 RepID=A0A5B0LTI3_PUCGR|nr:hypothetical protein PGTUg99_025643 [Puccinia graminis f. sp. tritici]KAA1071576.1 hypothetical protein PGT21_012120 [Puccinia graminis f. sp. tritici]